MRSPINSLFLFRRRFDPHHRADRFGRAGQRCPAELNPRLRHRALTRSPQPYIRPLRGRRDCYRCRSRWRSRLRCCACRARSDRTAPGEASSRATTEAPGTAAIIPETVHQHASVRYLPHLLDKSFEIARYKLEMQMERDKNMPQDWGRTAALSSEFPLDSASPQSTIEPRTTKRSTGRPHLYGI